MVLDEATSAVDMGTDTLIQMSIREEFGGSTTLIVIAHRLSSVADFDRVLVLENGEVGEFGTPRELMGCGEDRSTGGGKGGKGLFRHMVDVSGERERLRELILGEVKVSGEDEDGV